MCCGRRSSWRTRMGFCVVEWEFLCLLESSSSFIYFNTCCKRSIVTTIIPQALACNSLLPEFRPPLIPITFSSNPRRIPAEAKTNNSYGREFQLDVYSSDLRQTPAEVKKKGITTYSMVGKVAIGRTLQWVIFYVMHGATYAVQYRFKKLIF